MGSEMCIRDRMAPDADAEMREVAGMIYDQLYEVSPTLFPKRKVDND